MAELSGFWTTSGTPAGDQQASYTQAQWSTAARIMAGCHGFEGIAIFLNGLAGTVTGANTVAIDTGGAIVDGKWYQNSASVNVNIPSAVGGGNTRIDRIVLRCSWAAFTVRITRIAGVDAGSPTAPAITQTSGTTYDILLYQALVDTGGTVTLTDEHTWAQIPTGGIVDANVTQGKLAPGASKVTNRKGGSATDWATVGTNNYVPTSVKIQCGSGSGTTGVAITFPVAFSAQPVVFLESWTGLDVILEVSEVAADHFHVAFSGGATTAFFWLAIGPE